MPVGSIPYFTRNGRRSLTDRSSFLMNSASGTIASTPRFKIESCSATVCMRSNGSCRRSGFSLTERGRRPEGPARTGKVSICRYTGFLLASTDKDPVLARCFRSRLQSSGLLRDRDLGGLVCSSSKQLADRVGPSRIASLHAHGITRRRIRLKHAIDRIEGDICSSSSCCSSSTWSPRCSRPKGG